MEIAKPDRTYNPCKDISCTNEKITVVLDGKEVIAYKSQSILNLTKENGIKIPTLCYHPDLKLAGNCRICIVEVNGKIETACSYRIETKVEILTYTERIRKFRKELLELILSDHCGECYSCIRNGNCELQLLAMDYGITTLSFTRKIPEEKISSNHPIIRDKSKCILCRRCIRTCIDLQNVGVYEIKNRGKESILTTFENSPMEETNCINCGQCINRCPTGALSERDDTEKVWNELNNEEKIVIIQTAPAPRAGIGEIFGLKAGTPMTGKLTKALKLLGFEKVFDTCLTADLTIMEEGTELLKRIVAGKPLPMFTSCSPGWVKYLEHFYPEYIENLSTAKSPQQMFGAIVKTFYAANEGIDPKNIVSVALMPCTAKKFEADRKEMNSSGYKDVDYGLTTREIGRMIKECGIDLPNLSEDAFSDFFTGESSSGVIFGYSGGVLESALRSIYNLISEEKSRDIDKILKKYTLEGFEEIICIDMTIHNTCKVPKILQNHFHDFSSFEGVTLKTAIVHGTGNASLVLDNIKKGGIFKEFHFIEFMACKGGCLGGGGQPIPTNSYIREQRKNAITLIEEKNNIRCSYENPSVIRLYKEFLGGTPNSEEAHKYLHTHYIKRYNNER